MVFPSFYKSKLEFKLENYSNVLFRLQEIESKLDTLKGQDQVVMTQVNPTPEPRRLSLPGRFTSLPDLSHSPNLQIPTPSSVNGRSPTSPRKFEKIVTDERKFETEENDDELSSTCSTSTLMEIKNMKKVRIDLLDIYLCLHL